MGLNAEEKSPFAEAQTTLRPVDIREHWNEAPEVPLAQDDPENIITDKSLFAWTGEIKRLERLGITKEMTAFKDFEVPVLSRELFDKYHELHFLSRSNAIKGLKAIAKDIKDNFDPADTLIMLDTGSVTFFHHLIEKDLEGFGTVKEIGRSGEFEIRARAKFAQEDPSKAKKIIYIDDWVLSGEQFMKSAAQIIPKDQLFSYHLVMSDRGKYLYDKYGFSGKCIFRLEGEDEPESFFGQFSIYGFHKIPDVLPAYFADSVKGHDPEYSIFPEVDGEPIGRHSRLVRY